MPDIRTKYFTRLINKCVRENPRERIQDMGSLLSIIKENIRLLETSFFLPDYGNEFCRFCGKGKLAKFGKLKGPFEPAQRPGLTDYLTGYGMILWGCPDCGVAFLFNDGIQKCPNVEMENLSSLHISHKLREIPDVIDLDAFLYYCRSSAPQRQGATEEYPTDRLFPDYRLPAPSRISKMRSALPRRLQDQEFLLLRQ